MANRSCTTARPRQFKHQGKLETARNPASTYREIRR
jgi:hypothetical protein